MRLAEVELPPRLSDHPPHDAPLAAIQRVIGFHARVPPVASGSFRTRARFDRGEAGAGAALVGGQLPVEKLDQIVLAQGLMHSLCFHTCHPSNELHCPSRAALALVERLSP